MWKVTIKGLLAHKLRFVLTGVAVILGIAFLSGTLVLTATIENTFDNLFTEIYEGTDVQVRGVEPDVSSFFGETPRASVSDAVLQSVRGVDGVAVASPSVDVSYAQIIGADGDPLGGTGPPTIGFSYEENDDLNPLVLEPGSNPPATDDQIVIDKGSADDGDLAVGDTVTVLTQQQPKQYELVGIARFGTADSPLGATIVQFTLAEAQRIVDLPADEFSNIGVVAESGVSQDELASRIRSAVSAENVEVITGAQLTEENQDDVDDLLSIFNVVLLLFAAVSLFVSCFIIYNTFTIIVTQRAREMALLRAIGASTRQVTTSIVLEALVVGVLASLIGFGAGILLAGGLKALLDAFGIDIPASDIVIPPIALIASLIVGTAVTVFSAVVPARKASRVPPVAAIRDVAVEHRRGFGRRTVIGLVILGLGMGLVLYSLFSLPDNALLYLGAGVIAVFIGVFVLGPVIARPVSRVLGAPLPRIKGMTGTLARENAIRNPRRTAATAAALMIGVSLVGFITIFAASAKASISVTLDRQLQTDYVITGGSGFGAVQLSPDLAVAVSDLPEIAAASGVRYQGFKLDGDDDILTAFDTSVASRILDLGVEEGTLEELTVDGVAVRREWADDEDAELGSVLMMTFPAGTVPMTVEAIFEGAEFTTGTTGDFVISLEAFDANYPPQQQLDLFVFATLAEGVTAEQGREAIDAVLVDYPTADLRDNAEFKELQEAAINQIVNLIYGLLFLAVIIALIGIANTLALSIYERRRELGLLRAVGMSRSQVRSSVRWESVIIAIFGTLMGLVIGLFFGWSVVRAVKEEGFTEFAVAPGQLLIVIIVAALAGVAAAYFPARRASKLDILQAIATE